MSGLLQSGKGGSGAEIATDGLEAAVRRAGLSRWIASATPDASTIRRTAASWASHERQVRMPDTNEGDCHRLPTPPPRPSPHGGGRKKGQPSTGDEGENRASPAMEMREKEAIPARGGR